MKKIVLASGSPRRKKILHQLGFNFESSSSSVEETYDPNDEPLEIVQYLALRKAKDIAKKHQEALIIGADTLVVHKSNILEKPASKNEAVEMLESLKNSTHEVLTGVALVKVYDSGNKMEDHTFFESTEVQFGDIPQNLITNYVKMGSPMDKAGSYGIQDDLGALFVEGIKGDYYNVVGFPIYAFYKNMRVFAPEYLPANLA
ncbi:MAG: Maf family protein [Balneolaceae bacterium]|nr:Maf family protein [Balneolaceae bacterium]